ncbi:hypothetical protein BRE01_48360 [Brevibacillus reuszeri]|uniref:DUF4085 family protein n=1 Tax=Brevibacillus reuszeri TaxID=54915 RepID=A0A0K9Z002_9BACL|nr:DUF4085 family protein [Brevibacillus reuszeri]KNB73800.1 hypothetical protein ADS79_07670 [Brevibacillus reuszeri]MED1860057.1 DUF4085 family protein [Brevibacillus reuszeri]GED71134.1 hypothetical protein BRE01_48360 [Brevibacillus reuszeri]
MNYFTKDWYGEMQVYGFLTFPETIEDWEENLAYYESEGINYKENLQREIEDRKEDLLRFLPASFHPYILDYSIRSEYPTPELRAMAQQWEENYRKRMELIWQDYNAIYLANKHLLPENVVQLHEKSLHDATVKAYEVPSDDVLVLTLDCSGGFHYFTDIQLIFTGVKELVIPKKWQGAWWLYNEIYSTEQGFELHVLFDCPLLEWKIVAENVQIKEVK